MTTVGIYWFQSHQSSVLKTSELLKTLTQPLTYEDYFYLPDNVERDGYVFVGWFDDNGVQYYGGQWLYTDSLTLHAVFEPLQ